MNKHAKPRQPFLSSGRGIAFGEALLLCVVVAQTDKNVSYEPTFYRRNTDVLLDYGLYLSHVDNHLHQGPARRLSVFCFLSFSESNTHGQKRHDSVSLPNKLALLVRVCFDQGWVFILLCPCHDERISLRY